MFAVNENKALVFVGMAGSGKSICVDHLKNKNLPSAYFGGITIDEVKKRGLEVNERNERFVREDIRSKEGKGAYAIRILKMVEEFFEKGNKFVVVDGLYSWTEYKIFKEILEDRAIIIAVIAPKQLRHQRLATRPVRPFDEAEANSRDYAEIENIEKGGPIANADHYLINNSSVEKILLDLDSLTASLGLQV